jgi:glycogen debranching enzyme
VLAWAGDLAEAPSSPVAVVAAARRRNRAVRAAARPADPPAALLAAAADAFIVRTPAGVDAVAGYPGPACRPAETLAAYEGLFLSTGRAAEGRDLLGRYAEELPGLPLEARLWCLHATDRHVAATGDTDLAAKLLPALRRAVERLRAGRADGLLAVPGRGKPVAVNALWVNGLAAVAALARLVGADPGRVPEAHDRARAGFRSRFPAPAGWLHAAVDVPAPRYPLGGPDRYDDDTLRGEQLLAWSLPYAPMDPQPAAVAAVGAALLTPMGLRRLSEDAPVRPWLLGPYANAAVRAGLDIGELFLGIESHLTEFGLGSVSEAADGKPPHAAAGRPFQAWPVAELLRVRGFDHPSF